MKVMNIGIIIRDDHNNTFPVALNNQMVSVIQNLLTQIPLSHSKIVGSDGKKVSSRGASVPIIPRIVEFDWDMAYQPMNKVQELEMMKKLQEQYDEAELPEKTEVTAEEAAGLTSKSDGSKEDDPDNKVTKLEKPGLFTDKLNPYNLELDAKGRTNVDLEQGVSDTEPDPNADDRVSIGSEKAGEMAADAETAVVEEETKEMEDGIEKAAEGDGLFEDTTLAEAAEGGEQADVTVKPDALNLSGKNEL